MDRAIRNGEIEVVETCSGKKIELRELAAYALQQWPLTVIEKALGREAALILPGRCGRGGSTLGCRGISSGRCRCWPRTAGSRWRRC